MAKENASPSLRSPQEWAAQKKTDPMLLAAATVGKLWDRDPMIVLSESQFDQAIKWAEGISAS